MALNAKKDPVGLEKLFQTPPRWMKRQKRRKRSLMAVRKSRGESPTMMKANSERATKHHAPPPLHQGPSKENYNNTAFSFLINEDCYFVGGRAGFKKSCMIGKHQTGLSVYESVCVCVGISGPLHVHVCCVTMSLLSIRLSSMCVCVCVSAAWQAILPLVNKTCHQWTWLLVFFFLE